jgi:hypothetical protein
LNVFDVMNDWLFNFNQFSDSDDFVN